MEIDGSRELLMDNSYERLTSLLGKLRDSPEFHQLIEDLCETPERISESEHIAVDAFWKTGVLIHSVSDRIEEVCFRLSAATSGPGTGGYYNGDLPYGIVHSDDRAAVLEKVGAIPRSKRVKGKSAAAPEDYWESFNKGALELSFIFDGRTRCTCTLSVYQSDFETRWAQDLFSKSYR